MSQNCLVCLLLSLSLLLSSCTDHEQTTNNITHKPVSIDNQSELNIYSGDDSEDVILAAAQTGDDSEDVILAAAQKPWKGDLDAMVERGFIRILTTYNPLFFSYTGIEQHGLMVEAAGLLEKQINKKVGSKK